MDENSGIPSHAGMGRYYCVVDGRSDMGPEERYQRLEDQEQRAAGSSGYGRPDLDRADLDRDRNESGGDSGLYRSDPAPEGVILGRLYRIIFGGVPYTKNHDAEVRAAYQRVSRALEGLDEDVLLLMQATLMSGLD